MGKIKGSDFMFYADGSVIGTAKTFEYTLSGNFAETTLLEDGDWDSFLPCGGKKLEGTMDSLIMRDTDSSMGLRYFLNCWYNDVSIAGQYKPIDASGCPYITTAVWVSDIKVSNPGNKDFMAFSVSIKGTGKAELEG
jgi:hypothetical protein